MFHNFFLYIFIIHCNRGFLFYNLKVVVVNKVISDNHLYYFVVILTKNIKIDL